MKQPKTFHCRLQKTGPTTPVTVRFTNYANNRTLAVQLTGARPPWAAFATITVNLNWPVQDQDHAFIDTNNCPWAEEFLCDNGIAEFAGVTGKSGFCTYPLYRFNRDVTWEEKES